MNVISGYTVMNWQKHTREEKEQHNSRFHKIRKKDARRKSIKQLVVDPNELNAEDWKNQNPYEVVDNHRLTVRKLENYFMILHAIEDNLIEYKMLKRRIADAYDTVLDLNSDLQDELLEDIEEIAEEDEEVSDDGGTVNSAEREPLSPIHRGGIDDGRRGSLSSLNNFGGDAMSKLMQMDDNTAVS